MRACGYISLSAAKGTSAMGAAMYCTWLGLGCLGLGCLGLLGLGPLN